MAGIGQQLAEVPISSMIESLALGIAKAQKALDDNSVATLQKFGKETITIGKEKKSLLECGLLPSFYFFSEATLELRISLSMRSEESTTVGMQANVSGQKSSSNQSTGQQGAPQQSAGQQDASKQSTTSYGASVNFENSRKFGFSAEGSTSVTVRLLTVPPPAQLLMLIQSP